MDLPASCCRHLESAAASSTSCWVTAFQVRVIHRVIHIPPDGIYFTEFLLHSLIKCDSLEAFSFWKPVNISKWDFSSWSHWVFLLLNANLSSLFLGSFHNMKVENLNCSNLRIFSSGKWRRNLLKKQTLFENYSPGSGLHCFSESKLLILTWLAAGVLKTRLFDCISWFVITTPLAPPPSWGCGCTILL